MNQINEDECDYIIEQKLPKQVERDYLEDKQFRIVKMEHFLDATNTPFPYRSFYLPLREVEMQMKYNPYYILKHVVRRTNESTEVCVEKDKCILESNDNYLNEEIEL